MLQIIAQFIADLRRSCSAFGDFCAGPLFLQEMLRILYPVVCNSDIVSAETELNSKDSALTLDIDRYGLRPSSAQSNPPPLWRDTTVGITGDSPQIAGGSTRATPLRRGSSFVLVTP